MIETRRIKTRHKVALVAVGLVLTGALYACGSMRQTSSPAESMVTAGMPDFSLSVSPVAVTLTAGGSAEPVQVLATALNGFTGSIAVALGSPPAGVTATPAALTLMPGAPQTVNISAAQSAAAVSASLTLTATSVALSHSAQVAITVASASGPQPSSGVGVSNDVTTYHNDIARTGEDLNETMLTLANVNSSSFGKINFLTTDGKVDAEPLYLGNLTVGGQMHNVLYVATEHDSVYAFDADTGQILWQKSLLESGENTASNGCYQITPEAGITATPVLDRSYGADGAIFVVAMSQDSSGNYHQRLHALDATTGAELAGSPAEIEASYPGTGDNSSGGNVIFDPGQYAERAGLLLMNGTLYTGWTSHCDFRPYTGWLMAYNESTLKQSAVLNLTPNGSEGSIWMSGAGLAADGNGNIYFLDANGTFDVTLSSSGFPSQGDFGNAFLKISTQNSSLAIADYFALDNTVSDSGMDLDLGSGGALILPDESDSSGQLHQLAVGAGKDGNLYVVDRNNMGKFNANSNGAIYQELPGALPGGVFSMPAYFNSTVYYGGVGDPIQAFPITDAKFMVMPAASTANSFVYPGATPSISANGTSNGVVWAVENSNPAVLYAYNAATLQELYDSTQAAGGRDGFGPGNKFITPLIANGKVFVGTTNGVAVFGLLSN